MEHCFRKTFKAEVRTRRKGDQDGEHRMESECPFVAILSLTHEGTET